MYKKSSYKKVMGSSAGACVGFTLIEVQIYLLITISTVIMLTHIVLVYKHCYDATFVRAQKSILFLAAWRKINALSDAWAAGAGDDVLTLPLYVQKRSLMYAAARSTIVLLDDVDSCTFSLDKRAGRVVGITYCVNYGKRNVTWYHACKGGTISC